MNALSSYLRESVRELHQVTWMKQDELLQATITTVVFVVISAAILGIVDLGLSSAYRWLLNL